MTIKFTRLDLDYILTQIQMAEAGQPPVNPLLSFGLREVAGTNNNGVPGQSTFGSSGQVFPTITDQLFQSAQVRDILLADDGAGPGRAATLDQPVGRQSERGHLSRLDGILGNADDVFVSGNAAAFAAQADAFSQLGAGYQNLTLPGADGIYGVNPVTGINDDTGTRFAGADGFRQRR